MSTNSTAIVFDIRNFSAHRHHLGQKTGGGTLLTDLVADILNDAVNILRPKGEGPSAEHLLNHTGDGFVLVIGGRDNALKALRWIGEFRGRVAARLQRYHREKKKKFSEKEFPNIGRLDPLKFGIGADYGVVLPFKFNSFREGEKRDGFLGTAVNVASRVEQSTKDHSCNVICTHRLWNAVKQLNRTDADFRAHSLGEHRLRGFPKSFTLYCLNA
jgi:class 3 adenylate cyclase